MIDKRQAHSTMPKSRNQSRLNYSKLSTSSLLHTTVHASNTFNEIILETKLQFYILPMSMHDLKRVLKVNENSSIGSSSLAAATSSDASTVS